MTPENKAKLRELERTDVIVRNCMQHAKTTNMSREDALAFMVINLHSVMETYKDLCTEYARLTGISPKI
jgi:hypothetical protein